MPACSFCKKSYNAPRGLTIFQLDGKSIHYCSSKCRRNHALKRDPRKTNWIKKQKIGKTEVTSNQEQVKEKSVEVA